jgi:hypothetical protein
VSVKPTADGLYGVRDRIVYPLAPGMMGVEAVTGFPVAPETAMLMIQYRGPLGMNYSQLYQFSWDETADRYRVDALDPPQPRKCVRVVPPELTTPWWRKLPKHFVRRPTNFAEFHSRHCVSTGELTSPRYADERGSWFPLNAS